MDERCVKVHNRSVVKRIARKADRRLGILVEREELAIFLRRSSPIPTRRCPVKPAPVQGSDGAIVSAFTPALR